MLFRSTLVLACLTVLLPSVAGAYSRTKTSTGIAVSWKNPCIEMRFFLGSPAPLMTAAQYLAAAENAAAAWSHDQLACSDIRLMVAEDPAADAITGRDKQHMIVLRQDSWCPRGSDANTAGCYPANALAITTVWKNTKTGEIPDADIEINAVKSADGSGFLWNDVVTNPGQGIDFQNMLTHELGHVIGFAHNCYTAGDVQPSLVDHTGAPTLDCYSGTLPASVLEATMFPSVNPQDYSRRSLSPDDQQAVCDVYPYTHTVCPVAASSGGCAVSPTPATAVRAFVAMLFLGGLVLLGGRTIRTRARSRRH